MPSKIVVATSSGKPCGSCVATVSIALSTPSGQWILRLPQEDFCQARGVSPAGKYESAGDPGIEELAQVLRGSQNARADMRTLLASQVAFWLMAATDGHAKNSGRTRGWRWQSPERTATTTWRASCGATSTRLSPGAAGETMPRTSSASCWQRKRDGDPGAGRRPLHDRVGRRGQQVRTHLPGGRAGGTLRLTLAGEAPAGHAGAS